MNEVNVRVVVRVGIHVHACMYVCGVVTDRNSKKDYVKCLIYSNDYHHVLEV